MGRGGGGRSRESGAGAGRATEAAPDGLSRPPTRAGLRQSTWRGFAWAGGGNLARQIVGVSVTLVLARTLGPEAFGLIAVILVVLGLAEALVDLGLGPAIVQARAVDERLLSSAFAATSASACVFAIGVAAAAQLAAGFFGRHELAPLLRASALGLLTLPFAGLQRALLMRRMDFGGLALVDVSEVLVYAAVAVPLASAGLGVWSLVLGRLAGQVAALPIARRRGGWRLSWRFDPKSLGGPLRFGWNVALLRVVTAVRLACDRVAVGRLLGAVPLGYYDLALGGVSRPAALVSLPLGRVALPAFSSIGSERERTRAAYLEMLRYVSLALAPVMGGLALVAPEAVATVLGPAWSPAAPLLRVLAAGGLARTLAVAASAVFLAQGRSDLDLRFGLLGAAGLALAVLPATLAGVAGVAWAYSLSACAISAWSLGAAARLIGLPAGAAARALAPGLLATLAMVGLLAVARSAVASVWRLPAPVLLVVSVAAGALLYALALRRGGIRIGRGLGALFASGRPAPDRAEGGCDRAGLDA